MMYVEMTKDLEVNLMGMSWEEAIALLRMIEGAGLQGVVCSTVCFSS